MNKGELVNAVAQTTGVTKKEVDTIVSATLDKIVDIVATGGKVTLVGFGSFESRDRKARDGRNPKTGEKITIPATTVPAFAAGKAFKERVSAS